MQKGYIHVVLTILLTLTIFAAGIGIVLWKKGYFAPVTPKACTLEALVCPDGSAVGRSGPNCEFAACPSNKLSQIPIASSSADITNWKTYTSAQYRFTIMYPPDWIAEDRSNQISTDLNFSKAVARIYPPDTEQNKYRPYLSISLYDINAYQSSKDFIQKMYKDTPYKTLVPPGSLANLDVMEVDGLPGGGNPGPELVVGSKIGILDFFTELHGGLEDEALPQQIFATFKFY